MGINRLDINWGGLFQRAVLTTETGKLRIAVLRAILARVSC